MLAQLGRLHAGVPAEAAAVRPFARVTVALVPGEFTCKTTNTVEAGVPGRGALPCGSARASSAWRAPPTRNHIRGTCAAFHGCVYSARV